MRVQLLYCLIKNRNRTLKVCPQSGQAFFWTEIAKYVSFIHFGGEAPAGLYKVIKAQKSIPEPAQNRKEKTI